jgi:hypothetical protein
LRGQLSWKTDLAVKKTESNGPHLRGLHLEVLLVRQGSDLRLMILDSLVESVARHNSLAGFTRID